jgi:hypothetical protein
MATAAASDRQWYIVGRWEEFGGEARANLLRIVAIGAFYGVQLAQHYMLTTPTAASTAFHQRATAVAVAWVLVALAVMVSLRLRLLPVGLKYAVAVCDLALLTALTSLAAGPHSPLVLGYFLIIALSALRFSLGLVWFTTLGAMAGYWLLAGLEDAKTSRWFDSQHAVPPVTQLITLLSLALTGIVIGQVVRRVKALAEEYADRRASSVKTAQ